MEVGQNIPVTREDEPGACGCGGGLITPVVGGDGGGDAHGGVDIGGIDLCRSHELPGVDPGNVNDTVVPKTGENIGDILCGCGLCDCRRSLLLPGNEQCSTCTQRAAQNRAAERQGDRGTAHLIFRFRVGGILLWSLVCPPVFVFKLVVHGWISFLVFVFYIVPGSAELTLKFS